MRTGGRLGHFDIVGPLGAGGMGEVYRARDTRLGREVAIKVFPASLASDPDRLHRFELEARAASALNDPNILVVHDVGTHESLPYVVTELLEGETLRARLGNGALPVRKAIEVAVQIASGLAAAHGKGIVHRDLKPENLFLTSAGHVKILDFGLAKLTHPEPVAGSAAAMPTAPVLTEAGAVLGTIGYMAPEQVRGLDCDHRADIFAFGCVLYEMLSGRRAFSGATAADVMSAVLTKDPPPLAGSGDDAPRVLQSIVSQCLEKRPEERFSSAHDLALALRAVSGEWGQAPREPGARAGWRRGRRAAVIGAGVAALLVTGAVAAWWSLARHAAAVPEMAGSRRIAVLPFENLGAAEDSYFADGMTDEVRSKLTALSGLAVIARGSAMQYRGSTKTPTQIANELGAPYLLTATVRWQKGGPGTSRIRVTPELVEISGAGVPTTRWQDSFDADLADVFKVQAEIATRVAGSLQVALGAGEQQRLAERPTANLAAYDAYLRGQDSSGDLSRQTPAILRSAIAQYEQAVALDSGFALAWTQLSRARSFLYHSGDPSPALAESARDAAERALSLVPGLPEGRWAAGAYYMFVKLEPGRAREEFARGLASAPKHAGLLTGLANAERRLGRLEEARGHLEQACSLDPRWVLGPFVLGETLLWQQHYSEALAAYDRALALDPTNPILYRAKVMVFLGQGDQAGARAVVAAASQRVGVAALVPTLARGACSFVLDDTQQELVLRLTPAAFDDNRAVWALTLAKTSALRGDRAGVRRFAEEARQAYQSQIGGAPDNGELRVHDGLALAYLGRREEAIREGRRSLELVPISGNAAEGPNIQHQLVRIYIILGEHEKALDLLEPLLAIPYYLSPAWLSIDPTFAPLRGNPRFEKLLAKREATR